MALPSYHDETQFLVLNLQEVGSDFLYDCSSLKKINLKGLRNLQKVGYAFLSGCSKLEELDLSDLSNLHAPR